MLDHSIGTGDTEHNVVHKDTVAYAPVASQEEADDGNTERGISDYHSQEPWLCLSLNSLLTLSLVVSVVVLALCYTDQLPNLAALFSRLPLSALIDDPVLLSSRRGYVALVYSGTLRTFSSCFHSHLINVIAPSPYTVHVFMQADIVHDSELATLDATLDYYSGWYDADNRYMRVRDAIKGTRLEPRTNLSVIEALYARELAVIGTDWTDSEPSRVFAQLESNRLANELRLQYEKAAGVEYTHVFRMRWDTTFKTPVWNTLFHIEPRTNMPLTVTAGHGHVAERWEPVVNRTYVLYDMTYTYRIDSTQWIIPGCDWYLGGYNDQFSVSNSTVMTLLSDRGHDMAVFATDTEANPWRFHAESFFRRVMEFHGVRPPVLADQCHSKLEGNGVECGVNGYGKDCCMWYCPMWRAKERRLTEQLQPFHTLSSYVQHLPAEWNVTVDSSSYQSYWRHRRPELSVACLVEEEQKKQPMPNMLPPPNPYFHVQLPYIVRQQEQLKRFLVHDICPPS